MKTLFISLIIFLVILDGCDGIVDDNNNFDYSIEQKMNCFCGQNDIWSKLFITADTVASAYRISDHYIFNYNEFKFYKSIKDLFNIISETDTNDYILKVTYDLNYIYPSFLSLKSKPIIVNDSTIIITSDDNISYSTRNYSKLK